MVVPWVAEKNSVLSRNLKAVLSDVHGGADSLRKPASLMSYAMCAILNPRF